jgi:Uma2 family endonuclease
MLDAPAELLAERRRLGHDLFDEMWEGELHMVPPPSEEHQRIELRLAVALLPAADAAGLHLRVETGVFDPGFPDDESFRTPDLVLFDESVRSKRGVEGAARLAVEIRSPGDESFAKLPFYERMGVGEFLVIDRDDKSIRHWRREGESLIETPPASDGSYRLAALAVTLRSDDHGDEPRLVVTVADHTSVV